MDIPTRNLREYVGERGINLTRVAKKTGIPYMALYDSLSQKGRERDLRVGEFLSVCTFLGIDPAAFYSDKDAG